MDKKDKQIIKDVALVIADKAVSQIVGLGLAWELSKALYSAGLKLRQQRALEWVEMVRDNPGIFTREILEQEEFQDGFVFALEKYLTERSEEKRKYFRDIFMGYVKVDLRSEFELEKFIHTLSQMNGRDIEVLKYIDIHTTNSYRVFDDREYLPNIYNLINLGILYIDPSPRLGHIESPFVFTSLFGRQFIKYLKVDY